MDEKNVISISESAKGVGNSKFGSRVGLGLVFFFGLLPPSICFVAMQWDGHLYDRKGCVQIQEAGERVFKVDTCAGDTKELTE